MSNSDSEEKKHYEHLLSFFKNMVYIVSAVITILTAIAIYYTSGNMSDMRIELRDNLDDMKTEMKDLSSTAEKTVLSIQSQTEKQLGIIQSEAHSIALSEARERVEEAFQGNNVQLLVERTAEKKLREKLMK